jgi:hypothetical protein
MKIAMFEIEPWERAAFEDLETDHEILYRDGPLDADAARYVADAESSRSSSTRNSTATSWIGSTGSS